MGSPVDYSTLTLQSCLDFISTGEIHEYQDEIEMELEQSRPKLRGMYASYAKPGTTQGSCSAAMQVL